MEIWAVLLLALLPGLGNFAGGMLAEFRGASPRMLNFALHAASGIVIGIVAVELIPAALEGLAGWWIALAVAAGGVAYVLIEAGVERLQQKKGNGTDRTSMWMIYVAVAVDLTADGLMLGSGTAVSLAFGVTLAAGQVLADLPEGFAAVANLLSRHAVLAQIRHRCEALGHIGKHLTRSKRQAECQGDGRPASEHQAVCRQVHGNRNIDHPHAGAIRVGALPPLQLLDACLDQNVGDPTRPDGQSDPPPGEAVERRREKFGCDDADHDPGRCVERKVEHARRRASKLGKHAAREVPKTG